MSAAQISPAISVAIVFGEKPSWFSQRSCGVRGPLADDEVGGRADVLPVRGRRAAEPPGQHDRQRDLVELQARPARRPVDAGVLPPRAVGLLHAPQVVHEPVRRGVVAGRLLRGGDVVEVARPDQVVRARELVVLELERAPDPRHRRRRDRPAAVALVLGGVEHHQRLVVEPFAVPVAPHARRRRVQRAAGSAPSRRRSPRPRPRTRRSSERCAVAAGRLRVVAEADRERHPLPPAAAGEPRARRLDDVARRRGPVKRRSSAMSASRSSRGSLAEPA